MTITHLNPPDLHASDLFSHGVQPRRGTDDRRWWRR